jgi:phage-related tail protein
MVAPLIGAGIRAAGAAARGLAKKFGKKTEEPRERFKSSYDKAQEAEDKIKAAAEKQEKIKEGVKTAAKTTAKAAGATEPLAQPISLVRVCRHRKLAL